MEATNIFHDKSTTGGRFYYVEYGSSIAEITYTLKEGNVMVIDHTEVSIEAKGKGLGKILVAECAKYARENKLTIIPKCPFARVILEKFN